MSAAQTALSPRKSPVQARSASTLEALHVAVFQVLTREGLSRCTTTRIAERAGVSVGSLYQYYPNRDALLAAVLERHLDGMAEAVEDACRRLEGQPVAIMGAALAGAFLRAKMRDPEESRALYAVAAERGGAELAARVQRRVVAAFSAMLATASDARFDDPEVTATVALNAMVGPVRAVLEGQAPAGFADVLEGELTRLVGAYLDRYRTG